MTRHTDPPGTLADLLGFLWRHRILLAGVVGGFTILAVVYSLLIPVEYTAKATILPQDESGSMIAEAAQALMRAGLNVNPGTGPSGLVVQEAILRSERLADSVAVALDLDKRYEVHNRDSRLRIWGSRLQTKRNKDGLLVVSYRGRDPEFAVQVVDRTVEYLDRINREIRSSTSHRVRVFLEERLTETERHLHVLEDSLAAYQAENPSLAFSPIDQAERGGGAQILADRFKLETEVQVLKRSVGPDAPMLAAKELEINALNRELAKFPELNSKLARLLRILRVHQQTYAYLALQLEEKRIDEARDTPTVDVLDRPAVPTRKSYPKRAYIVLSVFLFATILALVLAAVLDAAGTARGRRETSSAG